MHFFAIHYKFIPFAHGAEENLFVGHFDCNRFYGADSEYFETLFYQSFSTTPLPDKYHSLEERDRCSSTREIRNRESLKIYQRDDCDTHTFSVIQRSRESGRGPFRPGHGGPSRPGHGGLFGPIRFPSTLATRSSIFATRPTRPTRPTISQTR